MRPFSTLGLKPFLWADESALKQIQTRFYELSRKLHPDRTVNLPDEEREALESQAAALNADYARVRDTWKLLENVVAEGKEAAARTSKAPPALAMEYFELQEKLMDEGPSPALKAAADDLRQKAQAEIQAAEQSVLELARRYTFQGFEENFTGAPWSTADLAELSARLDRVRFARSFLRDFETKFPA